jgi:transcriptional regulator with XRE-family HTH domain
MADFYEYSTPELVRLLGSRFKDYRMRCNLTQKEVAEQSGIGLTTIHKFENGTAGNLSLSTFISLLRVVGQVNALDDVLLELPESPYLVRREEKKAQRIRHTNKK